MKVFNKNFHKKNVYIWLLILVILVLFAYLMFSQKAVEGFSDYKIDGQFTMSVDRVIRSYRSNRKGNFRTGDRLTWLGNPNQIPDATFDGVQSAYTKFELYDRMINYPGDYIRVDTYTLIPYASPNNVLGCESEWEEKTLPDMSPSIKYFTQKPDWIVNEIRKKCNIQVTPEYLSQFPPRLQQRLSGFIAGQQKAIIDGKRRRIRDAKRIQGNCAQRRKDADGMFAPALRNAYEAQKQKDREDLKVATVENIKKDANTTIEDIAKETGSTAKKILDDPNVRKGLNVKLSAGNLKAASLRASPYSVVNTALKAAGVDLIKGAMEGILKVLTGDPFAGTECPVGFTEIDQINTDPTFQKINEIFPNPFSDFVNLGATTKACAKYEPGKPPEVKQKICDDKYVLYPEPMPTFDKQGELDRAAQATRENANLAKTQLDLANERLQKATNNFMRNILRAGVTSARNNYNTLNAAAESAKKLADEHRAAKLAVCEMDRDITKKLQLISDWVMNYSIANADSVYVIQNFQAVWVPNEFFLETVFQVADYSKSREYSVKNGRLSGAWVRLMNARFYFTKSGCSYTVFGYQYQNLDFIYQYKVDIKQELLFSPQPSDMFLLWQYAMEFNKPNPVDYAKTNSTNRQEIDFVKKQFADRAAKEEAERKEKAELLSFLNPNNDENIAYGLRNATNNELKERKEIFVKYNYDVKIPINHLPIDKLREKAKGDETKREIIATFNPDKNPQVQTIFESKTMDWIQRMNTLGKSARDKAMSTLNPTNTLTKRLELEILQTDELQVLVREKENRDKILTALNPSNDPQTATTLNQLTTNELNGRYRKWNDRKEAIQYFNPTSNNTTLNTLLNMPVAELNERMTLVKNLNPKNNDEKQGLNLLTLEVLRARVNELNKPMNDIKAFFNPDGYSYINDEIAKYSLADLQERMRLIKKLQQVNKGIRAVDFMQFRYVPSRYPNSKIRSDYSFLNINWDS